MHAYTFKHDYQMYGLSISHNNCIDYIDIKQLIEWINNANSKL